MNECALFPGKVEVLYYKLLNLSQFAKFLDIFTFLSEPYSEIKRRGERKKRRGEEEKEWEEEEEEGEVEEEKKEEKEEGEEEEKGGGRGGGVGEGEAAAATAAAAAAAAPSTVERACDAQAVGRLEPGGL